MPKVSSQAQILWTHFFKGMGLRLPEIGDPKVVGSNLTAIAFFHCNRG